MKKKNTYILIRDLTPKMRIFVVRYMYILSVVYLYATAHFNRQWHYYCMPT